MGEGYLARDTRLAREFAIASNKSAVLHLGLPVISKSGKGARPRGIRTVACGLELRFLLNRRHQSYMIIA